MKKIILAIALSSILAACSSTPSVSDKPAQLSSQPTTTVAAAQPIADAVVKKTAYPPKGVGGSLGERSIFYDFDKFTIKDQYRPIVDAHGNFLLGNKSAKIILQGNADERGSREYNLALGQRRADSVHKFLTAKGVPDNQIETISFGKEKPRSHGHNEKSWTENRRTDIVYQGE